MTSAAEMRTAIMDTLASLEIGQKHAYERFTQKGNALKELYQADDGQLNGWNLRRASFLKTEISTPLFRVRTTWKLTGYYALNDDDKSELVFDAQIDLVDKALSQDMTFGVGDRFDNYQLQMDQEPVMFAGVLCHQAVFTFDTAHEQMDSESSALNDFITFHAQYDIPPHVTAAQHQKWLREPPDHSASMPELTQTINLLGNQS